MFDVKTMPTIDWGMIMPVILVITAGVIALLFEMFRPKRVNGPIIATGLLGLGIAGALLVGQFGLTDAETFANMVTRDRVSTTLQLILVTVCALTFMFSEGYLREKRIAFAEFYPLALWSTAGAMIMVSTSNLLMLFIGLEVLSISLYVMAGLSRQESKSEESALKYFLLGAFASAFLLYGIAFIYGATGTLHYSGIAASWDNGLPGVKPLLTFGIGFMLIGLGFKAAFVPFHQWTPDVYQGAPTNVTAFMAAGSKVAAIGALTRVLTAAVSLEQFWMPVMFWVAIATMLIGNLVALKQKDVKRVLGYSSISNAGYLLVAVLAHVKAPDKVQTGTILFYLIGYIFTTIGAFAVVSMSAKNGREGTRFQDLYGLYKRSPFATFVLILCVISMIGVPPAVGFFGKLLIFNDAMAADLSPLAVVLAVSSIISIFYYVGIIRAAFVADEGLLENETSEMNFGLRAVCTICAAATICVSLLSEPILRNVSTPIVAQAYSGTKAGVGLSPVPESGVPDSSGDTKELPLGK